MNPIINANYEIKLDYEYNLFPSPYRRGLG